MIALLATLQMIAPAMPQITPPIPEMAFACTRNAEKGEVIWIALPNGLNKSEVLVSDPAQVLGRYTLTNYNWKIDVDGTLSVAFSSSNGDPKQPLFIVVQEESGSNSYRGMSHPVARPDKVTRYVCERTLGEQAANTIKLIRAESR
jgi:hypothetical protein